MEEANGRSRVVLLFGDEPTSNAKYRLPIGAILLVCFLVVFLSASEKGLVDLVPVTAGFLFVFQALGDRVWARNIRAAAWLRLAGFVSIGAGIVALATHSYFERQWGWVLYISVTCAIGVSWGVYSLFKRARVHS